MAAPRPSPLGVPGWRLLAVMGMALGVVMPLVWMRPDVLVMDLHKMQHSLVELTNRVGEQATGLRGLGSGLEAALGLGNPFFIPPKGSPVFRTRTPAELDALLARDVEVAHHRDDQRQTAMHHLLHLYHQTLLQDDPPLHAFHATARRLLAAEPRLAHEGYPLYLSLHYRLGPITRLLMSHITRDQLRDCVLEFDAYGETALHTMATNKAAGLTRLFHRLNQTRNSQVARATDVQLPVWAPESGPAPEGRWAFADMAHWIGAADLASVLDEDALHIADLNVPTRRGGNAPLHLAARTGLAAAARLLLAHGAEANPRNTAGYTPLMLAATHGHLPVVEALLAHRADPTLHDARARTTCDLVQRQPLLDPPLRANLGTLLQCPWVADAAPAPAACPRHRASELATEVFQLEFVELGIPLVIEADNLSWPARTLWTPAALAASADPSLAVSVGTRPYAALYGGRPSRMSLRDYARRFYDAPAPPATAEDALPYVFDAQVLARSPDLQAQLPPPTWLVGEHLVLRQLIIGPTNTGAAPHFHGHALNALATGHKRWWLYPPSASFFQLATAATFFANCFYDRGYTRWEVELRIVDPTMMVSRSSLELPSGAHPAIPTTTSVSSNDIVPDHLFMSLPTTSTPANVKDEAFLPHLVNEVPAPKGGYDAPILAPPSSSSGVPPSKRARRSGYAVTIELRNESNELVAEGTMNLTRSARRYIKLTLQHSTGVLTRNLVKTHVRVMDSNSQEVLLTGVGDRPIHFGNNKQRQRDRQSLMDAQKIADMDLEKRRNLAMNKWHRILARVGQLAEQVRRRHLYYGSDTDEQVLRVSALLEATFSETFGVAPPSKLDESLDNRDHPMPWTTVHSSQSDSSPNPALQSQLLVAAELLRQSEHTGDHTGDHSRAAQDTAQLPGPGQSGPGLKPATTVGSKPITIPINELTHPRPPMTGGSLAISTGARPTLGHQHHAEGDLTSDNDQAAAWNAATVLNQLSSRPTSSPGGPQQTSTAAALQLPEGMPRPTATPTPSLPASLQNKDMAVAAMVATAQRSGFAPSFSTPTIADDIAAVDSALQASASTSASQTSASEDTPTTTTPSLGIEQTCQEKEQLSFATAGLSHKPFQRSGTNLEALSMLLTTDKGGAVGNTLIEPPALSSANESVRCAFLQVPLNVLVAIPLYVDQLTQPTHLGACSCHTQLTRL
ncbi:uncharacterized protein MONBRDRAFT_10555 [Monosiga brevicollis MX1]|uniref:Uncharacterized protein n=1 Tax=Monosiga brevicollis TaxID=81824 RepID=A9V6Q6_MONBE|nr:uncharacterized protein MONBRDRAFT_10555 [Monosiga brevicollis MX1]EDQ86848.1 predicted protein [Monosiga brevicollis MX1]|eukprot:XP_001748393.1 hypothetical protein [Monosiga brevicollis MX1]